MTKDEHALIRYHTELMGIAGAVRSILSWDHEITGDEAAGLSNVIERVAIFLEELINQEGGSS